MMCICYLLLGRHGIGPSAFPAILLLEVLRSTRHGSNRDGLHLPRVQDRGGATKTPRRPQRLQPHQADPSPKVSHQPQMSFLIRTQFINLFINQFCR